MVAKCHTTLVATIQLAAVLQVWLVPCLIASFFFNGVFPFFIISASLQLIPILFNLVVMSHYWHRVLLVIGLLLNGIGGAAAMATVVVAWADPRYGKTLQRSPSMAEGNVILLLVASITTFSSALQIILLCMKSDPDKSYSCCWGNFEESVGPGPKRAPPRFIHLIRTMRAMGVLVFVASLFVWWTFAFTGFDAASYASTPRIQTTYVRLRVLMMFYFVMAALWAIIATVLSYNINSQRKLRFAVFNSILVVLLSIAVAVAMFYVAKGVVRWQSLGPAPWVMLISAIFQINWIICAFNLTYSGYPFRDNSCCWPDCTSEQTLEEEFDIWNEEAEELDADGL